MKQIITITIDVEVHDVKALYQCAKEHMVYEGMDEKDVPYFLLDDDDEIDAGQCLIELLDRPENLVGAEIIGSSCEE